MIDINISQHTNSLCLVGDLNTSFLQNEKRLQISNETTDALIDLCKSCNLDLTTGAIEANIDHIFLPHNFCLNHTVVPKVFIPKHTLSDHQGVVVEIG